MPDGGFTWGQAIGLALISGVVGALGGPIINWAREYLTHQRTKNEQAALLGSRVAVILEKFAQETAGRVGETDTWLSSSNHAGTCITDLPALDAFPNDAQWSALPKELFSRVFEFQNQRGHTQGTIDNAYEHDQEIAADDFCREGSKCALSALELAKDLRASLDLPARDASKDVWDFEDTIRQAAAKKANTGLSFD
jgi:hypothetical protein